MNVLGIICEFNPFHKGHKYLADTAKKLSGADFVIGVMSGNYVQRGEPAFADKYFRAKTALENGFDVIIELPCVYSLASAEYFSKAAVAILDKTGVVTHIAFGCECDDTSLITGIAKIMTDEPDFISSKIKNNIKSGKNYAGAVYDAWASHISSELSLDAEYVRSLLKSPNNILALEYLKALSQRRSSIIPVPVKRTRAQYHDTSEKNAAYSATALRSLILSGNINTKDVDKDIRSLYSELRHIIVPDDFSLLLGQHLLGQMSSCSYDFTKYLDISKDFSNKICNNIPHFRSFEDYASRLKSKNMTLLRIKRALFHIMLDIREDDVRNYIKNDYVEYIRILGFREGAADIVKLICKNIDTVININHTDVSNNMLKTSLYGDSLYRLVMMNKYKIDIPDENSRMVLKIPNTYPD